MIPYGRQSISASDLWVVMKALKSEFLTTGPKIEEFELNLQEFTGAPTVVVTSGTAALHASYFAIGLKQDDEVITPPNTFIATQAAASMFGAKPVFADIQKGTGNIDPESVISKITRNTKAIVAVDFAGQAADLDELRMIADKHGIFLIEDAAHSLGSNYRGKKIGSIADLTTFSFYPTKNITTGEGGAISSNNLELLNRARLFSRQGVIRESSNFKHHHDGPWYTEVHEFGLNYRLPDILCALGISQLKKLSAFKEKRKKIRDRYLNELKNFEQIGTLTELSDRESVWHLFPIFVDPRVQLDLYKHFHKFGVKVQVNYIPAYRHPVFRNQYNFSEFPNAELHYRSEISLPIYSEITNRQINHVITTLKDFY